MSQHFLPLFNPLLLYSTVLNVVMLYFPFTVFLTSSQISSKLHQIQNKLRKILFFFTINFHYPKNHQEISDLSKNVLKNAENFQRNFEVEFKFKEMRRNS